MEKDLGLFPGGGVVLPLASCGGDYSSLDLSCRCCFQGNAAQVLQDTGRGSEMGPRPTNLRLWPGA